MNTKQMNVIIELDSGYPNPMIPEVAATDWIVFIHRGNPPLANAKDGNKNMIEIASLV